MSKYNKKLNRQRQQIKATGQKDMGYKPQHKKGCGLFLLIVGLTLMSMSAIMINQVFS